MNNKRINYFLGMIREDTRRNENKMDFTLYILNSSLTLKDNTKNTIFELEGPFLWFKEL